MILLLFFLVATATAQLDWAINNEGSVWLTLNGAEWLIGGDTRLHTNGKWYSAMEGSLLLANRSSSQGTDTLGDYVQESLEWKTSNGTVLWITRLREYKELHSLVFVQEFPQGIEDLSLSTNGDHSPATVWPSFFGDTDAVLRLHKTTFVGTFAPPVYSRGLTDAYVGGSTGGVPIVLTNDANQVMIFSPWTTPKASIYGVGSHNGHAVLESGIMGTILSLPSNFATSSLLTWGQGVKNTMMEWGSVLLKAGGKAPTPVDSDIISKTLGYWTDNGAYYYYNCFLDGETCEDTFVKVVKHHKEVGLPVRHFQLDSWWYWIDHGTMGKEGSGGCLLWEPRPDAFPNGIGGFQKEIGLPLALHSRFWAPKNKYEANGNPYAFVDSPRAAAPQKPAEFFQHLMDHAKEKKWGMALYEQDWLDNEFLRVKEMGHRNMMIKPIGGTGHGNALWSDDGSCLVVLQRNRKKGEKEKELSADEGSRANPAIRVVLKELSAPVLLVDNTGVVQLANAAGQRMLGVDRVQGKNLLEMFSTEETTWKGVLAQIADGEQFSIQGGRLDAAVIPEVDLWVVTQYATPLEDGLSAHSIAQCVLQATREAAIVVHRVGSSEPAIIETSSVRAVRALGISAASQPLHNVVLPLDPSVGDDWIHSPGEHEEDIAVRSADGRRVAGAKVWVGRGKSVPGAGGLRYAMMFRRAKE